MAKKVTYQEFRDALEIDIRGNSPRAYYQLGALQFLVADLAARKLSGKDQQELLSELKRLAIRCQAIQSL